MQLEQLAALLGDVTRADAFRYGAKDDCGNTLDCLKVVPDGASGYLGVYHTMIGGVFHLNLARSTDLLTWKWLRTIDDHASQGALHRLPNGGFLVAYERDAPNSCWIRVRHYARADDLQSGTVARSFDIDRTLAPTAEGTPSFESVTVPGDGNLSRSIIRLRLHYYRNGDVDRAASGTLTDFTKWKAAPDAAMDTAIEKYGVRGNIGGRARFDFQKRTYYVQEGQSARLDWASWRVFLMDDNVKSRRAVPIPMRTHKGSTSFANPFVAPIENGARLVVTMFCPSEGNAPGESGALVYIVKSPQVSPPPNS